MKTTGVRAVVVLYALVMLLCLASTTLASTTYAGRDYVGSAHAIMPENPDVNGYGGRWNALTGQHTKVRLLTERVTMDVFSTDCRVRAAFTFRNEGPACQVRMGFPEQAYNFSTGHIPLKQSILTDVVTKVDGKPFTAHRALLTIQHQTEDFQGYFTHWIKTLAFRRGQTRHITLSYWVPLGNSADEDMVESYTTYVRAAPGSKGEDQPDHTDCHVTVRLHEPELWQMTLGVIPWRSWVNQRGATFSYAFSDTEVPIGTGISLTRLPEGWLQLVNYYHSGIFPRYIRRSKPVFRRLTQTVTVPGHIKSGGTPIQLVPPALWRDGHSWVNLRTLCDFLREKPLGKGETSRQVYFVGSARDRTVTVQTLPLDVTFWPGRNIMRVRDNKTHQTRTVPLPQAPLSLETFVGSKLYVPAAAVAALWNGKVVVNPSTHSFDLLFSARSPLQKTNAT